VYLWPKGINFKAFVSISKDGSMVYSMGYSVIVTLIMFYVSKKPCQSFNKVSDNECQINLVHINKKQQVKARFYMDKVPDEIPIFSCPMPDVEIKIGQVSEYKFLRFLLPNC
jgi:hypothetical protein